MIELFRNILAECVAGTSGGDTPTETIVGVRPNEIAHGTLLRNFLHSVGSSNLVKTVYAWGQTTVQAEDLVFNDSSEGEVIEEFSENFPNIGISVLSHAFIVKSITKLKVLRVKASCMILLVSILTLE